MGVVLATVAAHPHQHQHQHNIHGSGGCRHTKTSVGIRVTVRVQTTLVLYVLNHIHIHMRNLYVGEFAFVELCCVGLFVYDLPSLTGAGSALVATKFPRAA